MIGTIVFVDLYIDNPGIKLSGFPIPKNINAALSCYTNRLDVVSNAMINNDSLYLVAASNYTGYFVFSGVYLKQ